MKITDLLQENTIITDLKARDKKGVLEELVKPVAEIVKISRQELVRVLMERERLGSTGIGDGIGIPHGKIKGMETIIIGCGISKSGVDFQSLDNRPTHLFFMILTPEESTGLHLRILAQLSKLLKNEAFREKLLKVSDKKDVYSIIKEEDEDF
jgi:PTS system nitrogen regulatory IIA component